MLGVKGNVGSDTPLVANFSVWKTSGSWVMLDGVRLGEDRGRSKMFFFWVNVVGLEIMGGLREV